jgi:nicotinate (nicotinamide) nucleotide adenylyltransferase
MSYAAPAKFARDVSLAWISPPQPLTPGLRIGLFGGSFNPAHRGHLYASELALRQLKLDFVWWLVSPQNPLKPTEGMASFAARMSAATQYVRNRRILVSDLEAQLHTRFTIDTLRSVTRRFPQIHFVWLMGSDNLVQLPRWRHWQRIFALTPIAVVARPGSTMSARHSIAARRFGFAYVRPSRLFAELPPPAWTILDGRRNSISGTALRATGAKRIEQLQSVTIGDVRPFNSTIELRPHDPDWAVHYRELEGRIRAALGPNALLVEHVGSTSVVGLSAKPIIDIVVGVPDSADERSYVPALEAAGFALRIREPNWFEHRMFKSSAPETNVHIFSSNCEEIVRMLSLRDRLRRSPEDRQLYEKTKQQLAGRQWQHIQDYADAKSEVIRQILATDW